MNVSAGQVLPGVYRVDVPFPAGWFPPDAPPATICYLVRQKGGWLMIDSGLDHSICYEALCRQLSALGISLVDIRWLLITHFHPDHFGLAARVKTATGARVIMHRRDWEVVRLILQHKPWPSGDRESVR